MKESSYNFEVEYKDKYIIYNVMTDILLPFKKKENNIIKTIIKDGRIDEFPVFKEFLFNKGFIVNDDVKEIDKYKFNYYNTIFNNDVYKITLNPTLDCNFNCWYCSVTARNARIKNSIMPPDIIKSVKKNIKHVVKKNTFKKIILDWFGGEPLLNYNLVLKPIAVFLKEISLTNNIEYGHFVTTNGYLIDNKMIKEFKELNINSFQITLDGDNSKHNKIRNHNGKGSFSKIINNIIDLSEFSKVIVRINYDNKTLENVQEIKKEIDKANRTNIIIDFQRIFQLDKIHKPELLENAIKLFEKDGYNISMWNFKPKKFHTCMFDKKNHSIINYNGKIFKCTARNYSEEEVVGYLNTNGEIIYNDNYYKYYSELFLTECINCKLLPLCNGPCLQKKVEYKKGLYEFKQICPLEQSDLNINTFIINKYKAIFNEKN